VTLCCEAAVPACAKIRPMSLCACARATLPLSACQKWIASGP
jgi:hypothetical protein